MAALLARRFDAAVELITVIDTSAVTDASGPPAWHQQRIAEARDEARRRLQAFADRHLTGIADVHLHVFDGGLDSPRPADEVVRAAEGMHCDLIVLGTHGKTGLEHLVLGSVAETVVRTSTIPVVTVRKRSDGV